MSFIHSDKNTETIKKLLASDENLKCAVAFWGSNAENLLAKASEKTQIICNLESGATNPYVIEKLIKKGVQVKTNKKLHAKVYLAKDQAIVGSANASANGLSYEDRQANGWLEASILIEDKDTLSEIDDWFSIQWEKANDVTKPLLENTKKIWKKKRNARELEVQQGSLLDYLRKNPGHFKDKNIFIIIHTDENLSEGAEEKMTEIKKHSKLSERPDCWEDWSDLPEDSESISLYYDKSEKRGEFTGFYYIPKPKIIEKIDKNKEILICYERDNINGMKLYKKDISILEDKTKSLLETNQSDDGVCISLYDARDIIFPIQEKA